MSGRYSTLLTEQISMKYYRFNRFTNKKLEKQYRESEFDLSISRLLAILAIICATAFSAMLRANSDQKLYFYTNFLSFLIFLTVYAYTQFITRHERTASHQYLITLSALLMTVYFHVNIAIVALTLPPGHEHELLLANWILPSIILPFVLLVFLFLPLQFVVMYLVSTCVFLGVLEHIASSWPYESLSITWTFLLLIPMFFSLDASNRQKFVLIQNYIEEIKSDKEKLVAAAVEKDQFVNFIFHEIRVPLNAISVGIDLLVEEKHTPSNREILHIMQSQSVSTRAILDDALLVSKIEAGMFTIDKHFYDLADMIANAKWIYGREAATREITLTSEIENSLSDKMHFGDMFRIRQVISNFLSNALKYTASSGKITLKTEIVTVGMPAVEMIKISVADTGKGISAEDVKKIFQPYVQVAQKRDMKGKGTGLGLNICKKIVEMHGGEVGVSSVEGEGSVFFFTLPCDLREKTADDYKKQEPASGQLEIRVDTVPEETQKRILLVEDSLPNRRIVGRMLKQFGYVCEEACNGKEALEKVRDGEFDIVVMDRQMPVMGGIEAIERIREMNCDVFIIGLTGNAMKSEIEEMIAAGADLCLTKPTSRTALKQACQAYGEKSVMSPRTSARMSMSIY